MDVGDFADSRIVNLSDMKTRHRSDLHKNHFAYNKNDDAAGKTHECYLPPLWKTLKERIRS